MPSNRCRNELNVRPLRRRKGQSMSFWQPKYSEANSTTISRNSSSLSSPVTAGNSFPSGPAVAILVLMASHFNNVRQYR